MVSHEDIVDLITLRLYSDYTLIALRLHSALRLCSDYPYYMHAAGWDIISIGSMFFFYLFLPLSYHDFFRLNRATASKTEDCFIIEQIILC